MTITAKDMEHLLEGQQAVVTDCEGSSHDDDSPGCLCSMKGTIITIGKKYDTVFAGTPTWWINNDKRARMSELTLIPKVKE